MKSDSKALHWQGNSLQNFQYVNPRTELQYGSNHTKPLKKLTHYFAEFLCGEGFNSFSLFVTNNS